MKTIGEIKGLMAQQGILAKFEKYAEKLNMTLEECIRSLAGNWEGEEDGLYRSVIEGDLENMLDEEVA